MTYRDAVPRLSIAQLRARFTPKALRALASVRLEFDGGIAEVPIVRAPGTGTAPKERSWFACGRCGGRVNVLGAVDGMGWVCQRCGRWRSRNRPDVPHAAA